MANNDLLMRIQLLVESGKATQELKNLQDQLKGLNDKIKELQSTKIAPITESIGRLQDISKQIKTTNIDNFSRSISDLKRSFSGFGLNVDRLNELGNEYDRFRNLKNSNSLETDRRNLQSIVDRLKEAQRYSLKDSAQIRNTDLLDAVRELDRYNSAIRTANANLLAHRKELVGLRSDLAKAAQVKFDPTIELTLRKLAGYGSGRQIVDFKISFDTLKSFNQELVRQQANLSGSKNQIVQYQNELAKLRVEAQKAAIPNLTSANVGGSIRNLIDDLKKAQAEVDNLRGRQLLPLQQQIRQLESSRSLAKAFTVEPLRANIQLMKALNAQASLNLAEEIRVRGETAKSLDLKKEILDRSKQIADLEVRSASANKDISDRFTRQIAGAKNLESGLKSQLSIYQEQEKGIRSLIAAQKEAARQDVQAVKTRAGGIIDTAQLKNQAKIESDIYRKNIESLKQYLEERKRLAVEESSGIKDKIGALQQQIAEGSINRAQLVEERSIVKSLIAAEKERSAAYQQTLKDQSASLKKSIADYTENERSIQANIRSLTTLNTAEAERQKLALQSQLREQTGKRSDLEGQVQLIESAAKAELARMAAAERSARQQLGFLGQLGRNFGTLSGAANEFRHALSFMFGPQMAGFAAAGAIDQMARSFFHLNEQAETLRRGLDAVFGSGQGGAQMEHLIEVSNRFGLEMTSLSRNYLNLTASSQGTALEGAKTEKIFQSLSAAMSVLGSDTVTTQRAFRAVSQMISKGQIYAEELKGQLAEALPGAIQLFAQSMKKSVPEFLALVKAGQVGINALVPFFDLVSERYSDISTSTTTFAQATARVHNAWFELMTTLGETGIWKAVIALVSGTAKEIKNIQSAIEAIGNTDVVAKIKVLFDLAGQTTPEEFGDKELKAAFDSAVKAITIKDSGLFDESIDKIRKYKGDILAELYAFDAKVTAALGSPLQTIGDGIDAINDRQLSIATSQESNQRLDELRRHLESIKILSKEAYLQENSFANIAPDTFYANYVNDQKRAIAYTQKLIDDHLKEIDLLKKKKAALDSINLTTRIQGVQGDEIARWNNLIALREVESNQQAAILEATKKQFEFVKKIVAIDQQRSTAFSSVVNQQERELLLAEGYSDLQVKTLERQRQAALAQENLNRARQLGALFDTEQVQKNAELQKQVVESAGAYYKIAQQYASTAQSAELYRQALTQNIDLLEKQLALEIKNSEEQQRQSGNADVQQGPVLQTLRNVIAERKKERDALSGVVDSQRQSIALSNLELKGRRELKQLEFERLDAIDQVRDKAAELSKLSYDDPEGFKQLSKASKDAYESYRLRIQAEEEIRKAQAETANENKRQLLELAKLELDRAKAKAIAAGNDYGVQQIQNALDEIAKLNQEINKTEKKSALEDPANTLSTFKKSLGDANEFAKNNAVAIATQVDVGSAVASAVESFNRSDNKPLVELNAKLNIVASDSSTLSQTIPVDPVSLFGIPDINEALVSADARIVNTKDLFVQSFGTIKEKAIETAKIIRDNLLAQGKPSVVRIETGVAAATTPDGFKSQTETRRLIIEPIVDQAKLRQLDRDVSVPVEKKIDPVVDAAKLNSIGSVPLKFDAAKIESETTETARKIKDALDRGLDTVDLSRLLTKSDVSQMNRQLVDGLQQQGVQLKIDPNVSVQDAEGWRKNVNRLVATGPGLSFPIENFQVQAKSFDDLVAEGNRYMKLRAQVEADPNSVAKLNDDLANNPRYNANLPVQVTADDASLQAVHQQIQNSDAGSIRVTADASSLIGEIQTKLKQLQDSGATNIKVELDQSTGKLIVTADTSKATEQMKALVDGIESSEVVQNVRLNVVNPEAIRRAMGGLATPVPGFARGGFLGGYGGGDRIHALLEPGEFVVRKEAVKRWGLSNLEALNALRVPIPTASARDNIAVPRLASGGAIGSVNLNISLGGQQFRLKGSRDQVKSFVDTMTKAARAL